MEAAHQPALESEVVLLYREHSPELLRWAMALAPDPDLARDAVQESFLRYFVERRYGRTIDKPRSWLYVVMRNYLARSGAGQPRVVGGEAVDRVASDTGDPEQLAQNAELWRRILALLTPREAACLRLRAEGHEYAEIADLMSVRPGTVGAVLSRIQAKLRAAVNGQRAGQAKPAGPFCASLRTSAP